MTTQLDASKPSRPVKESPSNALLLSEWRKLKHLRSSINNPSVDPTRKIALYNQALIQKRYVFRFYVDDACLNAYSHWKHKVPKKSLLTAEDSISVVLLRMWRDMDDFDPDYAREEDWLVPENNMFMMWFNSAPIIGGKGRPINRSRLIGALEDEKRRLMNFPRKTPDQLRRFNEGMSKLRQKLGKTPTLEEYMDEYGWDKIEDVKNPLLHSQVFSQSNARPGEHIDQELRFDGDRRRQEQEPEVSMQQAIDKMQARVDREAQLMAMIPQTECALHLIAYYFWGWNIPDQAARYNLSSTLISKRKHTAEEAVLKYFGTRERMLSWIQGDLVISNLGKAKPPGSKLQLPKAAFNFS